jgi:hypothetical protein
MAGELGYMLYHTTPVSVKLRIRMSSIMRWRSGVVMTHSSRTGVGDLFATPRCASCASPYADCRDDRKRTIESMAYDALAVLAFCLLIAAQRFF